MHQCSAGRVQCAPENVFLHTPMILASERKAEGVLVEHQCVKQ